MEGYLASRQSEFKLRFSFSFSFFLVGGGGGGGREGDGGAAVNVCFFIASLCFSFISTAYPITIKNELP